MEYVRLNGTGIEVSGICLGTSPFGKQTEEKDAIDIVHMALDHGINFIDTADSYNNGASESCIGKALRGRRDEAIVATKVFFPTKAGPNGSGLSRKHIIESAENSLRRLQTDYIDLYYLHAPDKNTPLEESLEAMSTLVKSGKVRYIGMSNYAAWQIGDALWKSERHHTVPPSVVQCGYNLLSRTMETELVPFLQEKKMGLVVYQPLAAGMLTGKYRFDQKADPNSRLALDMLHRDRYWNETNFQMVEKLSEIARESGINLATLALKWCSQQPAVSSVLVGVSRKEQLEQNLEAFDVPRLSAEVCTACDEIWKMKMHGVFQYNR